MFCGWCTRNPQWACPGWLAAYAAESAKPFRYHFQPGSCGARRARAGIFPPLAKPRRTPRPRRQPAGHRCADPGGLGAHRHAGSDAALAGRHHARRELGDDRRRAAGFRAFLLHAAARSARTSRGLSVALPAAAAVPGGADGRRAQHAAGRRADPAARGGGGVRRHRRDRRRARRGRAAGAGGVPAARRDRRDHRPVGSGRHLPRRRCAIAADPAGRGRKPAQRCRGDRAGRRAARAADA